MKYYIYENNRTFDLEPLSLTRPTFSIRCGPFTFLERIKNFLPNSAEILLFVRDSLKNLVQEQYPDVEVNPDKVGSGIWLLGTVYWNPADIQIVSNKKDTIFKNKDAMIGANLSKKEGSDWLEKGGPVADDVQTDENMQEIGSQPVNYLWDILYEIPKTMESDNKLFRVKEGKVNSEKNLHIIHPENTWIDESCILNPSIVIDSTQGSVIIDKNVEIGSFSYLEGPLFIGEKSKIHPLTKLKRSIIGPECRIGGEVDQTIIQGFSNKAHDGHLGDAFLGEWVNLGAGTNNSNLKNNYTSVDVTVHGSKIDTGNLFIGSFIGDHSKTAIGTQLNTGTSIGVGCNIVSKSFPPRNLPSFTWHINGRRVSAKLDKFIQTVSVVKNRRSKTFSRIERVFYESLFHEIHSEL